MPICIQHCFKILLWLTFFYHTSFIRFYKLSLDNENVGVKFCLFEQTSDTINTCEPLAEFITDVLSLCTR